MPFGYTRPSAVPFPRAMPIEKSVKTINDTLGESHKASIVSSGSTGDHLCLFSKDCGDGINRIACSRVPTTPSMRFCVITSDCMPVPAMGDKPIDHPLIVWFPESCRGRVLKRTVSHRINKDQRYVAKERGSSRERTSKCAQRQRGVRCRLPRSVLSRL
jgi:hypothetical protein